MKRQWILLVSLAASLALAAPLAADGILGTPVNLGPLINSSGNEGSPEVSSDGLELYFNSNRPGGLGATDLWVSKRPNTESPWGEPKNLGPVVNTAAAEIAPCISGDGLELYFADYQGPRPGGLGKSDLWVTRRASKDGEWGAPVNLGSVVNTPYEEITPDISANGLELYFETDRPGGVGGDDLWVATRPSKNAPWGPAAWLGPVINQAGNDHCPNLTADGLAMFFDATPAGAAVGDLMIMTRATVRGEWRKPVSLGRIASDHFASSVSSDGTTLYFASTRPGGSGGNDIWLMPILLSAP
jgi:Tol biopolymer transport system component